MPASQKVTISKNGEGETVVSTADAGILDVATTLFSTEQALTGMLGVAQKGLILFGGMAAQEFRRSGNLNPL